MLRLWRLFQGGMGSGCLPDPGGSLDQPVLMIEAFAVMSATEAGLQDRENGGTSGRWTRQEVVAVRAQIARAKELYPDGPATGALLDAVMASRAGR